tara:strand:+ start:2175 stop:3008 length:834 start_codon:yes stop_codon:yes gene_type:complete
MNTLQKKPTGSQNIFIVLLFIVLFFIIIGFMYYNVTKDYRILVDEILPLFNNYQKKIPSEMIPLTPKLKMSMILWLYIDNNPENSQWFSNFTSDKYIINRDYSPAILYQPYNNSIKVILKTKDLRKNLKEENNVNSSSNTYYDFKEKKQSIEVSDIKYQHWNQIVVVIDNRYVDIYLNSILVKSALLDNVPIFNNKEITIGKPKHNPNCFLGRLEYKPDIIPLSEIKTLYLRDKDRFTIDGEIRKNINLDTMNIRKKEYTDKIIEDEIRIMNSADSV